MTVRPWPKGPAAPRDVPIKELTEQLLEFMVGANRMAFKTFGSKVLYGPFKGMEIPEVTPWNDGNSSTKLFGSYEHELHDTINVALGRSPKIIVNVGCAEGYYAIGLARAAPGTEVIAFDLDPDSRRVCREYADINGVHIEVLNGAMCPEQLQLGAPGPMLYVMDCEGAENELLDPARCPDLLGADLIVECHEFMRPGITQSVGDRFMRSHVVEVILPRFPCFEAYDFVSTFPTMISMLTLAEKRPMPTFWLRCWANSRGDHNG